jgi:hypothetical protein
MRRLLGRLKRFEHVGHTCFLSEDSVGEVGGEVDELEDGSLRRVLVK